MAFIDYGKQSMSFAARCLQFIGGGREERFLAGVRKARAPEVGRYYVEWTSRRRGDVG